jgi:hypothetical protein
MTQDYMPLPALAAEWANQAGVPVVMMTRRICEWAMTEAFAKGAFVNEVGDAIAPYDMLTAFRAAIGRGQANMAGITHYVQSQNMSAWLHGALISRSDLLAYCDKADVQPPPSVAGRAGWFRKPPPRKHPAPPDCPDVENCIARESARRDAAARLGIMGALLAGLHGKRRSGAPRRDPNEPVNLEYWNSRRETERQQAVAQIAKLGDAELQQALDELDRAWVTFVEAETARWKGQKPEPSTPPDEAPEGAAAEPDPAPAPPPPLHIIALGPKVRVGGHQVALSSASFRLLHEMAKGVAGGTPIVPLEQLRGLAGVGLGDKVLGQAVYRLRAELARDELPAGITRNWIENIKGIGYRLNLSPADVQLER